MTADNSPSRSLAAVDAGALPATLRPELEDAASYARAEKAEATRRAYRSDFAYLSSPPLLRPLRPFWPPRQPAARR
jgi:hypothetical protein